MWIRVFSGYIARSGTAGPHGNSVFRFFHMVFNSGCTNLHSHQQCERVPFSPHPLQHVLFVVFNDVAILTGHSLHYFTAVLICISLIISDIEHLSMCLLAICISSLEKCPFRLLVHFFIKLLVFLLWLLSSMSCLHILEIKPLSAASFANIFSDSIGCLFLFLMVSFAVLKACKFD